MDSSEVNLKRSIFQRWVIRLGAPKSVVLITLGSVLMSLLVTTMAFQVTGDPLDVSIFAVSIIVPLIVAPLASLTFINLLFELEKAHSKVRTLAMTDELTGAHNRRHFFEVAETEFERSLRHTIPLSVLLIDGDNFKKINDVYGHLCGDQVLKNLSHICMKTIRQHDVFARYGGEEFILLLPHTDSHGAQVLAERIRRLIAEKPISWEEQQIYFTVSIGIATSSPATREFTELVNHADQALYQAKKLGKNCLVVSTEPQTV